MAFVQQYVPSFQYRANHNNGKSIIQHSIVDDMHVCSLFKIVKQLHGYKMHKNVSSFKLVHTQTRKNFIAKVSNIY